MNHINPHDDQQQHYNNNKVWDCIIVGGGCAGMSAAHRLVFETQQQQSQSDNDDDNEDDDDDDDNNEDEEVQQPPRMLSLLLLEASDHVGGRTRNYNLQTQCYDTYHDDEDNNNADDNNGIDNNNGIGNNDNNDKNNVVKGVSDNIIELGGTWLSSEHTSTIHLCKEYLGLDIFRASFINNNNDRVNNNDDESQSDYSVTSTQQQKDKDKDDNKDNNSNNEEKKKKKNEIEDEEIMEEEEEEYKEFPWWFWGIDYAENEMKQLKRIILHRHVITNKKGDTSKKDAVTTFTTSRELLNSLDYKTVQQLDELKNNVINLDCDSIVVNNNDDDSNNQNQNKNKNNVWDVTNVQQNWYDLDIQSTTDRILLRRPATTTTVPDDDDDNKTATATIVKKVNNQKQSLLTTINGRNILRNCIHNMNADEPDNVSYFYNLISWSGSDSGGPDTEYRIRGGTQAIPLKIAEKLNSYSNSLLLQQQQQQQKQSKNKTKSSLLWGETQVMLNSPVRRIERVLSASQQHVQDNTAFTKQKTIFKITTGGDGTATTAGGRVFYCRTLLITGSPTAIHNSIDFVNTIKGNNNEINSENDGDDDDDDDDAFLVLPTIQKELISPSKMKMGKCIKFMAIYKNNGPWWKKYNLQGDIIACGGLPKTMMVDVRSSGNNGNNNDNVIGEGEEEEWVPLFPYCFDLSPKSQKYGVLCCFIEGIPYEHFHNTLSANQQKDLMTEFLKLSFQDFITKNDDIDGQQQPPLWVPDDFIIADWGPSSNKYVAGAYTGYFQPNILSQSKYWNAYRQVEKSTNLFWAGSDYHAGFGNGYIEGAVRSGQHAADLIQERLYSTS